MSDGRERRPPDAIPGIVETVIREVAKACGFTYEQVMGRRRTKSLARTRNFCMWAVRTSTGASYPEIGFAFGRDHTTIINGVRSGERALFQSEAHRLTVKLAVERAMLKDREC